MSNLVFILGAESSRRAGAPLMASYLDVATDLLRAQGVSIKAVLCCSLFTLNSASSHRPVQTAVWPLLGRSSGREFLGRSPGAARGG